MKQIELKKSFNELISEAKTQLEKKGFGFYNFGKQTLIYKGVYQVNVKPKGNEIKLKGTMNSVQPKYKLIAIPLWHKYIKKNDFNNFQENIFDELNQINNN